ncbi:cutinase family protein [Microbacterium rhizomatis]|uniref:cutinase family protein n=1 Tax=Microbacterium rhizomatis TaxID=1631477 RepID=UPI00147890F8|nr:cutinase family protein [Microbacterium rhizomatis]
MATPASAAQPFSVCSSSNVFIGVRGTGAPGGSVESTTGNAWQIGGMGDQVAGIADHFKNDSPYSEAWPTYVEALNYPASADLLNSISVGVETLREELNHLGSACPITPSIILAGHSQGAAVIDGVLKNPELINDRAKQQIKGVALLGDPGHSANMPYSAMNTASNGSMFMLPSEYSTINNTYRFWGWGESSQDPNPSWIPRVRDYCFTGDAACTGNFTDEGWYIHSIYTTVHPQVISWLDYMLTNTN